MLSTNICRVKFLLSETGVSTATASRLIDGLPQSRLLVVLRDQARLDSRMETALVEKLTLASRYQEALAPLPLPTDADTLRRLIESPITPDEIREFVQRIFS